MAKRKTPSVLPTLVARKQTSDLKFEILGLFQCAVAQGIDALGGEASIDDICEWFFGEGVYAKNAQVYSALRRMMKRDLIASRKTDSRKAVGKEITLFSVQPGAKKLVDLSAKFHVDYWGAE